jgi:hypothetical protein
MQHFRAFLWLRWRLFVNQLRRAGTANTVILAILLVGALCLSVVFFVSLFLVGLFALGDASPLILMYVWDGLIGFFLFWWLIGLVTELQRSEVLSLHKLLHLPVSPWNAFLINYLSSLLSVSLIVFVPGMVGLSLGLAFSRGPAALLELLLVAAFLLMVTALTHQFRGWLAALMVNPRRRNTVVVLLTLFVLVLSQLPNLLNLAQPRYSRELQDQIARRQKESKELTRQMWDKEITPEQFQERMAAFERREQARSEERNRQLGQQIEQVARIVNLAVPAGWLPWGAMSVAEGDALPALLCFLGMAGIGTFSLWRSYLTTVRLYRGEFSAGSKRPVAVAPKAPSGPMAPSMLEAKLPWLTEQASAVALASFRGLLRAPEAKMMLLSPLILMVIFGGMLFTQPLGDIPTSARPLVAFGAMAMLLLSMTQFAGNQFGFDRNGFRVYVLCGAPRRDILLGKNLAYAPLVLCLGVVVVGLLQLLCPMRIDHFLAFLPQALSMYLLFCLLANAMSIMGPIPIAPGSFQPSSIRRVPLLLQFGFVLVFPVVLSVTLLPLGCEVLLAALGWDGGVPVCLLLSLLGCAAVVWLYRLVLWGEGSWLQAREQRILEIVTAKAE